MLPALARPALLVPLAILGVSCERPAPPQPADTAHADPASHPAPAIDRPEPAMHVVEHHRPISGPLRLADVRFELPPEIAHATLVLEGAGSLAGTRIPMHLDPGGGDGGVYSARVMDPGGSGPIRVSLELADEGGSVEQVGPFEVDPAPAPELATPDWAKGAVWYQIFPERFRNGESANDPAGPHVFNPGWASDWWDVSTEELEAAWARRDVFFYGYDHERPGGMFREVVWNRRYGGDLQGVVEALDHIKAIGVTAIYFCPVFESDSLHKYDASDYRHIDASFGGQAPGAFPYAPPEGETEDPATWTWTDADRYFIDVVLPEAKKRGLRVIIDGVWNHVGLGHFAFQDLLKREFDSPYQDWFFARFDGAGRLVGWLAWDGVNGHLPKLRQTESGDLVKPVKDHIFAVTSRWMDPNGDGDPSDGIDGWRLDVAADVGRPFWKDWRAHVKSINPDAVIIAEEWGDADAWFDGTAWDAQMNYPFAKAIADFFSLAPGMDSDTLRARLAGVFHHRPETELIQFNLLDSHDTERVASMMQNPGPRGYDSNAGIEDVAEGRYDASRPSAESFRKSVLIAGVQATMVGAPMIYGGDELGMHGPDDPSNRKPIQWPGDAPPDNSADAPDLTVLDGYRAWLTLREDPEVGEVLRLGDLRLLNSGAPRVLAYERRVNDRAVLCVLNLGSDAYDAGPLLAGLERASERGPDAGSGSPVKPLSLRVWSGLTKR
ncbi:MAG: alpha-amylase family glycosyl hydrolase [Phycisphaerales bacterium]